MRLLYNVAQLWRSLIVCGSCDCGPGLRDWETAKPMRLNIIVIADKLCSRDFLVDTDNSTTVSL